MAELRGSEGHPTKQASSLAEMLRSPNTSYGTLIQSPSPFWAAWGGQQLAKTLDFVFIDTEHTPLDRQAVSAMCAMYSGLGLPSLVRVVEVEGARQALDGGAAGVVMPYIETVEQVRALRGAVKLRPLKGRLLSEALEGRFETGEIEEYVKTGGQKRALVLNIESQAAIDNLESLLAPELEVDAILIGPHDLSCNLGIPEQYAHPKFKEAVKTIFTKARAAGVGAAIHHIGPLFGEGLEEEDAAVMVSKWGCNNVVLGGDLTFFLLGLKTGIRKLKSLCGEEVEEEGGVGGVAA